MTTSFKKGLIIIIILVGLGCSKEKDECFEVFTTNLTMTKTVCHMTETQVQTVYGKYYDRADAPKYCWMVTYPSHSVFAEDITEKIASIAFADALNRQKVARDYCQEWLYTCRSIHKLTQQYENTQNVRKLFCGDTCATLYPSREIITGETADSIFKVIFVRKL